MKEIKSLTIKEYKKMKIEYFSTPGNEDKVIKCVSPGGYQIWTKHRTSIDELIDKYWRFEPLMRRYFSTKEQLADAINRQPICGIAYRWLFHKNDNDEVCLQVYSQYKYDSLEDTKINILDSINTSLKDRMFGMLMDPYMYIGEYKYTNEDEHKWLDNHNEGYKDENNYRVFYVEMTANEFDNEEQMFIDSVHGKPFNDGFLIGDGWDNYEISTEFKEFLKKNTHNYDYDE